MQVLRGTELSCDERGRSIHVLLLGLQPGPGLDRLADEVAELQRRRRERVVEICARFRRWNIQLEPEAVFAEAREGVPGRPHVAAALMKAGVVRTVREAFDRFLRDGGPADVPGPRLPVVRGVELGGRPAPGSAWPTPTARDRPTTLARCWNARARPGWAASRRFTALIHVRNRRPGYSSQTRWAWCARRDPTTTAR